jgi:glutamine amidotransferase
LVIVDVGLGNVASVRNMVRRLGSDAELRAVPDGLDASDRYILPGVGAFDEGIRRLQESGWFDHLVALDADTSVLGICLGMQLLGRSSEEGKLAGLGRLPIDFVRFTDVPQLPHMGWNLVTPRGDEHLFDPELPEYRYYFTHSYRAVAEDSSVVIGETVYGGPFPSMCRLDATYGVQFHPEKSHKFGMSLLSRWLANPC